MKPDPAHLPAQALPMPNCAGRQRAFSSFFPRFPASLAADLIRETTNPNDILLDPFSICGATAVEAVRNSRRAVIVERDSVTASLAEALLRPASLPLLRWAFEDVRRACLEEISALYATTCPKCGARGFVRKIHLKNGNALRIEYSCNDCGKKLEKKPDTDDRETEAEFSGMEIPFWHPVFPVHAAGRTLRYPQDMITRRSAGALSRIFQAIENLADNSAQFGLRAAFARALPATGRQNPAESEVEENPWPAFDASFLEFYNAKKETNRILKNAILGRSFPELASGRANILILVGTGPWTEVLPESSVDGVVSSAPSLGDGNGSLRTAIQAAWLRIPLSALPAEERGGECAALLRGIRRAAKPGSRMSILVPEKGKTDLHGLLNQMEESGLPVERIEYRNAADPRHESSAYILHAQAQKIEPKPPGAIPEAILLNKITAAARARFRVHGPETTARKILHAFYPRLEREEISSAAKHSIDDLLAQSVSGFAEMRHGKVIIRKGKLRTGGGKIPAKWRRTVLDAESLAAGNPGESAAARRSAVRLLAAEGFDGEDLEAVRAGLRPAEIERRRIARAAGLLGEWGRLLGRAVRKRNTGTACVIWKTARGGSMEFALLPENIQLATLQEDGQSSIWGAVSYPDLERGLLSWCRSHPEPGKPLAAKLFPLERPSADESGKAQASGANEADWQLTVVYNRKICERHFLLTLELPKGARLEYQPGQFFHIECDPDGGKRPYPLTLRRPLSIHRARYPAFDPAALKGSGDIPEELRLALEAHPARLEFLYRVVGEGTERLSRIRRGTVLKAIGPCGKGFRIGEEPTAVIAAGGIGIAPLAALAERLRFCGKEVLVYLGAVEKGMLNLAVTRGGGQECPGIGILEAVEEEFRRIGARVLTVCTDDGSVGERGLVTEMLERGIREGCVPRAGVRLYACGPAGMLKAVAQIAARHSLPCEVSLEERMACGIGACYSCTVAVRQADGQVLKQRVCREGPVFQARDIQWKD
ncbi:MAG: hypothetical protein JW929_08650 [Anaerolineales bacterium]|nr:hypothetical protein [Anaerolineales bacterium]